MSTATQATKKNHKKAAQQIVIMIDNINSIIDATTKALGSVSKRQQVLILTGLLVEIKANKLILTGSDVATTSRVCSEGIRSSSDCSFVVPAKLFSDVLKKLPSGKAKIIYTGKAIEILAEKARFHLNVLDASEYPQSVVKPLDKKVRINSQELARTLAVVVYAASTQESRPILTGISVNCDDGKDDVRRDRFS